MGAHRSKNMPGRDFIKASADALHFIGYNTRRANFSCAHAVKHRLLEMPEPKLLPYRSQPPSLN
jgi:hypothetical protein